ncbi:hypothetical protein Franean1_3162 [Parafrankia sp. EAN1pec]|nr:hypothetical protein Franean1_3162 [Frankia sp. EAN1pec]
MTGGNRHDVDQLIPLVEAIPPIHGRRGRPRRHPRDLLTDRAYDHVKYRRQLAAYGITPIIACRGKPHDTSLSRHCWPVERTIAAPPVPPAAHPLGTPRRHPPSVPQPRVLDHLLTETH